MLMVGFHGSRLGSGHPLRQDITERHLGGVILFNDRSEQIPSSGNIRDARQLRHLTKELQTASPTPLLIAVDQEGGRVCRLKPQFGFPLTVSFAWLGRQNDPALTHRHAAAIARTLLNSGINLNLSPVVDLNRNPANPVIGALERSFSIHPERVTTHAREVVLAHRQQGVLTALKHFPGHGSSAGDTHQGFVDVTPTWSEEELQPFADLTRAGLADAIMTAHVYNARLDRKYPATLSAATIEGLLRRRLGFDGVVISDDLRMKAISSNFSLETALEKAVNAGVDILLLADPDPGTTAQAIELIARLVAEGRIDPARIDQSYLRISRFKARLVGQD
jgi:beta-N-acetylhexosaminidase